MILYRSHIELAFLNYYQIIEVQLAPHYLQIKGFIPFAVDMGIFASIQGVITIKICLDDQCCSEKPANPASITRRIANCVIDIELQQLATQLVQPYGRSFIPAWFNRNERGVCVRNNASWAGQEIFCLDFDSGISFTDVIERCTSYEIMPAFAYSTFSSVNNDKFRLVFKLPFEITDIRVRNLIQFTLLGLFPEADKACRDAARLFYGGKELVYTDYCSTIDISDLLESMCLFFHETDPKHARRNITGFCESCGLQMLNGLPRWEKQCLSVAEFGDIATSPIIYVYRSDPEIPKNDTSLLNSDGEESVILYFAQENVGEALKTSGNKILKFEVKNENKDRMYVNHFDFENLADNCRLYKEFITGTIHLFHDVRFNLACNLLMIKGGSKKLEEGIKAREEYDSERWRHHANFIIDSDYKPVRCDKFCPYCNECNHVENMLRQGKLKRGDIQIIRTPTLKSLEQAEIELKEVVNSALTADDDKVYVIKAPTGIGKSELYLNVKDAIIAVPTHRLKNEIYQRMRCAGFEAVTTPEPPLLSTSQMRKLNGYYDIGAYGSAAMYIKYLAEKEGVVAAAKYLQDLATAKASSYSIVTTHERALFFNDNKRKLIIDEDIIPTLLKQDCVIIDDLRYLYRVAIRESYGSTLESLIDNAIKAPNNIITAMPSVLGVNSGKLELLIANDRLISSNVLGFLKSQYFVKRTVFGKDILFFINQRTLPQKKTIILSATANEYLYKKIFGDRLEFIDIGSVETVGRIVQYPQRSFSRYQLKRNTSELMDLVNPIIGDVPVITYKKFKDEFGESAICNFGATCGIDEYRGKDIAVVGTPHINPVVYALYSASVGLHTSITDFKSMGYIPIERNGFRFNFQTYSDNDELQEIQFYFIESELVQAVGRARILRNDCTVKVFSNYPLPGAEFKYYEGK